MQRIGLGLRARRDGDNTVAVYLLEHIGWAHLTASGTPVLGATLKSNLDAIGLCPGDVADAVAAHFAPVVHAGDLPEGEPWDAPHRRHEEAMELLKRLERRANR